MDKSLINSNRKWHQNVMNLLMGKNICGVCLNLDDNLVEWENTYVFEQDDLNVESSLKHIMASAFTTSILDIISTTKFCQKCIDVILKAFILIHEIKVNYNNIHKRITEISQQMKWTQYLDETGSLSDIKDNSIVIVENKNGDAKKENGTQTEKNLSMDQDITTRKIILNDESLKEKLLLDLEMHSFLYKKEENKEIKLPVEITVKKVMKSSCIKDPVSHELLQSNWAEDTDYESIIPNIQVLRNKNFTNDYFEMEKVKAYENCEKLPPNNESKDVNVENSLSVKLVDGSNIIHNSEDKMDIVPEDLLELKWPEYDTGNTEYCMKIPVKKLNFNEALTVKFIPSQNTSKCQENDSEFAPHELLELSWNEDSENIDMETKSLKTGQKHNIDLTKWLEDQGMSTIKTNLFHKRQIVDPQIVNQNEKNVKKQSEKYNETDDYRHIEMDNIDPSNFMSSNIDCNDVEIKPMFIINKGSEEIRCALCCLTFDKFKSYSSHYITHGITEMAKCHRCPSEFSMIELLPEHLLLIHSENVGYCEVCFAILSQERLAHHISTYHETKGKTLSNLEEKTAVNLESKSDLYCKNCKQPYDEKSSASHACIDKNSRCNVCKKACIHEKYLSSYRKQLKANKRTFKCTDCKFRYKNKSDIIRHSNEVHLKYKPYRCRVCNIGFSLKVSLGKHNNSYHVRCERCRRVFENQLTMSKHKCNSTKATIKIKCELCGQKFTESKYKQHKESALLVPEECLVCRQIVAVKCNMVRHIEYVHNLCLKEGSESILYKCLVCERKFNNAKEFSTHNWEHTGKHRYKT